MEGLSDASQALYETLFLEKKNLRHPRSLRVSSLFINHHLSNIEFFPVQSYNISVLNIEVLNHRLQYI